MADSDARGGDLIFADHNHLTFAGPSDNLPVEIIEGLEVIWRTTVEDLRTAPIIIVEGQGLNGRYRLVKELEGEDDDG